MPSYLLAFASFLHFFTMAGHLYGHTLVFSGSPSRNGHASLVALAKDTFEDFGTARSHYIYYEGLSHLCTAFEAYLGLTLAALAGTPKKDRAMATVAALLASGAIAAVSWGHFIQPPAVATTVATVLIALDLLVGGGKGDKAGKAA